MGSYRDSDGGRSSRESPALAASSPSTLPVAPPRDRLFVGRLPALLFGALVALFALGAMLVLVGSLLGFGPGPHLDAGPAPPSAAAALVIDLALLAAFALPHSVLARGRVKQRLARMVPAALQRSVYVLLAALAVAGLVFAWQPLPAVLWQAEVAGARLALVALALAGWGLALVGSLAVGPLELFGFASAWRYARGVAEPTPRLVVGGLYAHVRQPINLGTLVALWATPDLTQGRLLLATALSLYVGVGSFFEERDLERRFGAEWTAYRRAVPALLPRRRPWSPERPPPAAGPAAGACEERA